MRLSVLSRSMLIGLTAISMSGCVIQLSKNKHHDDDADAYYSTDSRQNISNVNDDIRVEAGQKVDVVDSVNGDIHLDDHSHIKHASTVNGDISIRNDVTISQNLSSVNGDIGVGKSSLIEGNISTVNGDIKLKSTQVNGGISTTNGNIRITGHSVIKGDIRFEKQRNHFFWGVYDSRSVLEIGPDVTIQGKIVLYQKVKLELANPALKQHIEYRDREAR